MNIRNLIRHELLCVIGYDVIISYDVKRRYDVISCNDTPSGLVIPTENSNFRGQNEVTVLEGVLNHNFNNFICKARTKNYISLPVQIDFHDNNLITHFVCYSDSYHMNHMLRVIS